MKTFANKVVASAPVPGRRVWQNLFIATATLGLLSFLHLQAQEGSPTDDMLVEFGIKPYASYQQDFTSMSTMGFQADAAPGTDVGPAWFDYWKDQLGVSASSLANLRYYVRRNPLPVTDANFKQFENVQRVMRLLPEYKFNKMFPFTRFLLGAENVMVTDLNGTSFMTGAASDPSSALALVYWHTPGTLGRQPHSVYFSYDNFLKAVALMPGFCGDYSDYPDEALRPELQARADLIARKFLASVFAHAVQETSNSGSGTAATMSEKIPGTFASVVEVNGGLYPDDEGLFGIKVGGSIANKGPLYPLNLLPGGAVHEGKPVSHAYCGRGIKQTSYPTNYANASLFLFGDLRLLAYPELIEEPGIMAFLSGLVYAMQPKDSNPSIFEVMDGTFHRKLAELAANPATAADPAFQAFVATYDQEFPLTVLLVNGGPECNGNKDNKNNTKIRIAAYNDFVTTDALLNHVQVGGADATTPAFTPINPDSTTGDQFVPATAATVANEYYNLTGNQETCQLLLINTINQINSNLAWCKMFARPIYFGPNWQDKLAVQAYAYRTLPIFGGKPVHEVMARAFHLSDSDEDALTDEDELVTFQSDPFKASTFGDGLKDGEKFAIGLSPGTDFSTAIRTLRAQGAAAVEADPVSYGLYTSSSIEDLNLGGLMLDANGNGTATLRLQLQATSDLSQGFTDLGDPIEVQVDLPSDKYFLRVRALGPQ